MAASWMGHQGSLGEPMGADEWIGGIKLAVKDHMIREADLSVTKKFVLLRELGFDGVER